MTWMQTVSGRKFDLLNPNAADVDFDDIAEHLSRIPRFNGAAKSYSVAQHCCLGADALLDETGDALAALLFLLHDAEETYTGDKITPMKWAEAEHLAEVCDVEPQTVKYEMDKIGKRINARILEAAGVHLTCRDNDSWHLAKWMDERMCLTERAHLMGPPPEPWHPSIEDAEPVRMIGKIRIWPPEKAREEWLSRFNQWRPQAAAAE